MPHLIQQQVIKNEIASDINYNQTPDMNERDFLNDILANEKYITHGLNTFAWEASHQDLYNDVKQILNETQDCTRDIFNTMFQEGFYELEAAKPEKISKTNQQFTDYLNNQSPYR